MKFIPEIAGLLATLLLIPSTAFAQENIEGWEIESFQADITINADASINVQETILADFTNEAHRGIFRKIPTKYSGGDIIQDLLSPDKIEFLSATDANGESWVIDKYKSGNNIRIDMTNQTNTYNNNKNTFVINYIAHNVINPQDTHDELYWNVNGTDWGVKTKKVKAVIHLPEKINQSDILLTCATGQYGSMEQNCTQKIIDQKTLEFSTKNLNEFENLTVVIGIPKGIITHTPPKPSILQYLLVGLLMLVLFNAPITLIIMFTLWYKRGRDEKTIKNTVIPHYRAPHGLLPTETGTLIDEKIHPRDIVATIIHYAVNGYIKIREIKKEKLFGQSTDYELILIKPYKTTKEFEEKILSAIFETNKKDEKIKISGLKKTFHISLQKIKDSILNNMVKDGYFPHNPAKIRKIYLWIGGIIAFVSLQIIGPATVFSPILIVGVINLTISGIIIASIGFFMPRKTEKGTRAYYELKGLYEYIKTAEKDRMEFQEKHGILFEKLLPYAMAFGLIKKWTKAFEGILVAPPNWYSSYHAWSIHNFSMIALSDALDSFSDRLGQDITTNPQTGKSGAWGGGSGFSGGFSGGGFGGGGGGGL